MSYNCYLLRYRPKKIIPQNTFKETKYRHDASWSNKVLVIEICKNCEWERERIDSRAQNEGHYDETSSSGANPDAKEVALVVQEEQAILVKVYQ